MGTVEALCVGGKKGEKKTPIPCVSVVQNHGMAGDAHAGPWHRQVSLLAAEDIGAMRQKGLPDLKPGDFAENIVVSGVALNTLGLGSRIRIGSDVELVVTQIGKVCHTRCAIFHQTGDCIMPRLGLFARVLTGGAVAQGDPVDILEAVPREVHQAVVLTISDRCSGGAMADTAGPAVARRVQDALPAHLYTMRIIPEVPSRIEEALRHFSDGHSIDLVLAVGGTESAPRDVTSEAVAAVVERRTPGLDEAMRRASTDMTPHALPSRALSGVRGRTLIISLPGSERAAVESLDAIRPALVHGLPTLRGDPSDRGWQGAEGWLSARCEERSEP